jgi:hypothetical protein
MINDYILGADTDHYDAEDCFDDVAPRVKEVSRETQVAAAREIVRQAQASRLPAPFLRVEPTTGDVGDVDVEDVLGELLGVIEDDESDEPAPFTPVDSYDFPVTQKLHRKFKAALPSPKVMRVDTEESYKKFMDEKRAPYIAELEQRVARAEAALAQHASDGHGVAMDVLGADVEQAKQRALTGGDEIPMSLPPGTEKHVKVWQDGGQICCSMRLLGPDGKVRIATASSPVERHVEEVLTYTEDGDVNPMEVMGALPMMAQILGGGSLVTQIAAAAPELLARPEVKAGKPFVGKVTPVSDPAVAAIMALLQMCRAGDKRALKEVKKLRAMPGSDALFAAAQKGFEEAEAARKGGR